MGVLVGGRDRERQEEVIVLAFSFLCSDLWSLDEFLLECGRSHSGPKLSLTDSCFCPSLHSSPRREAWQTKQPHLGY